MRNTLTKIALLALMFIVSYKLEAHVVLDSPQGGETFTEGQTVTIQWHITIPHITLNWDLYFSTDGGMTWGVLYENLPASQLSYQWIVPAGTTSMARVSVIQDNDGMDYQDESNNFTITTPATAPNINVAASNITIECHITNQESAIQAWLNNHGGAAASNTCGDLVWTNNYSGLSNGCGASGSASVTFIATDPCGSDATTATLSIVDTSAPVIGTPPIDKSVECDGNGNLGELNQWLNSRGGAVASDVCSSVTWTNDYSAVSNGCGHTGSATVMFTATDQCGNSNSTSASFTIEDSLAPGFTAAARDTAIECGAANQDQVIQQWLGNHGGAKANDICGNVTWTNDFPSLPDTCGATHSLSINFVVTDECGNRNTTHASFTLLEPASTSTNDLHDFDFKIFPNPASDILEVDFNQNEFVAVRLSLFDTFGKSHWTYQGNEKEVLIPVNNFANGIYFVQVETAQGTYSRKVIIE